MRISRFRRYSITIVIVFLLCVLIWFVLPDPVFSQDERPAFSRNECPADDRGYTEKVSLGHRGGPGFLECRYEKEQEGYPNPQNSKFLYITYFENSEMALERISKDWLNDEYLRKFFCGDDCVEGQRVLVERTENSFYGYYVPYPDSEPDNFVLERGYIDGNYHVQIFAMGELEEAKSELAELTVVASELVETPREMVAPGTDTGDPTEEPEESPEITSEEELQDKADNSDIAELAELTMLFGTDPEKLSEWPGWGNLTDTQRENLIKIIDRLDEIWEVKKEQEIIRQAAEIVAEEINIYKDVNNYFAIASVEEKFGYEAAQDVYDAIYLDDFSGYGPPIIGSYSSSSIIEDHIFLMFSMDNLFGSNGTDISSEKIAQQAMYSNDFLKYITPEVMLWENYCNTNVDPEATLEEQHAEIMDQLRKDYHFFVDNEIYFDFSPGGPVDNALWNLVINNVGHPRELP